MVARGRIPFDGLSRCLCPSIDAIILSRGVNPPLNRSFTRSRNETPQVRALHAHKPRRTESPQRGTGSQRGSNSQLPINDVNLNDAVGRGFPDELAHGPLEVLYQHLHDLRYSQSQGRKIRLLLRWIVEGRRQKPDVRLYEALVVANWDTSGSAAELKAIFDEMRRTGIAFTLGFLHSMLRALAVHPSYLLRNEVLREIQALAPEAQAEPMLERVQRDQSLLEWTAEGSGLSPRGRCSVALGLLRDGQFEMAMDYLEDMMSSKVDFPVWVFDIFVLVLAKRGFVDAAVQLMTRRPDTKASEQGSVSPYTLWYFLLDECSSQHLHMETKFIWDELVESRGIHPSDGTITNVLNMAARYGDATLASQALEMLSSRMKLAIHHYEAMIDCYAKTGDLENVFRVLCIMHRAGVHPEAGSTRSLFALLQGSPKNTDKSLALLSEQKEQHHDFPIAAVDVVIEALCSQGRLQMALDLYRDIPHLCTEGASPQTFQFLLHKAAAPEHVRFILAQLDISTVPRKPAMYPSIIRCCLLAGQLDSAFAYLDPSQTADFSWLDRDTLLAAIEAFSDVQDPRTWDLVDLGRRLDMDIQSEVEGMVAAAERKEAEREIVDMASEVTVGTTTS